jgi:hypothetical protein
MRHFLSRAGLVLSAATLLGGASAVALGPSALAAPDSAAATLTSSASAASSAGLLNAVAAVSARNVWAVGCSGTCHGRDSLVLHWNGRSWAKIASPNPDAGLDELTGVSAVSASNVWAVGYGCSTAGCSAFKTLIVHWNGKKWSTVTSPDPSTVSNLLYGVTAVSATDVWAAGSATPDDSTLPATSLVLHWNGRKWSRVHSPTASGASTTLYGVSAASATDVWAVGNACIGCGAPGMTGDTFTVHWNGTKWSRVDGPGPSTGYNILFGVKTLGPDNAWAVGDTPSSSGIEALIGHWNGKDWSQVASANPGSSFDDLTAVTALSAGDVWAVGDETSGGFPYDTLTEQRAGGAWTAIASPNGTTTEINFLAGVAAISPADVVAVGWVQTNAGYRVLILKWNGTRWAIA